jgi:DNA-binding response OmpR family regulator/HPt (histidine-containing phosphotransfer) domain-containing protein
MKILLIEDDLLMASAVAETLTTHYYLVDIANDGLTGLELAETGNYDLILLDVVVPGVDGISLCRQLRSRGQKVLILLLTAKDSTTDRVLGLDAGADDYLAKPFDFAELLARIRSLLRRQSSTLLPVIGWGDLQFNPSAGEFTYQGKLLQLTPKEYALLELFLSNPRRVFSRSVILDRLWSLGEAPGEETVTSHIKTLRQQLKAAGAPTNLIETVYGLGYRLRSLPESGSAISASKSLPEFEMTQPLEQARVAVNQLRLRFRDSFVTQIETLEQAAIAISQNQLTSELHQQARQEAHKLAGSFGTFGYEQGSQLAQEVEQLLQFNSKLDSSLSQRLMALVVMLRQELAPADSPAAAVPNLETQATSTTYAKMRVLVIDDDIAILEFVRLLLEPWDLVVTLLANSQQFKEALETYTPDLLILDVEMPDLNGIQLCQAIRSLSRWAELPILVLSVHTDIETRRQVFTAGADDYVQKPIVEPELLTRVINRLEQIRMQRQLADLSCLNPYSQNRRKLSAGG